MFRQVNTRRQSILTYLPALEVSGLADRLLAQAFELDPSEPRVRAALLLAAARSAHSVEQSPTGFVRDACASYDMGRRVGFAELAHRDRDARRLVAEQIARQAIADHQGPDSLACSSRDETPPYVGSAAAADMAQEDPQG